MDTPLERALRSLDGLSVGDAFGQQFFACPDLISRRSVPAGPWRWTDDTNMAISVVEVLAGHGSIDQDDLAASFAARFDPTRGYGLGTRRFLRIVNRIPWRKANRDLFPEGSYGNGAAMRAAPVGAWFAGDLKRAAEEARLSAEVTHAHREGQAGAIAVAVAAALCAVGPRPAHELLESVSPWVPEGETRKGIEIALTIPPSEPREAAVRLGAGERVSSQDTVPWCLWCASHHQEGYAEALWRAVSALGDRDTTCAIVGGIVALSAPEIPREWLRAREPLPRIELAL